MFGMKSLWPGASNNVMTLDGVSKHVWATSIVTPRHLTTTHQQTSTIRPSKPFDAYCCHMGTAIKHPVPDLVKPYAICNFWQPRASECPNVKNYKWRLNPVWHRLLYSGTHMSTVGVKKLILCDTTISENSQPFKMVTWLTEWGLMAQFRSLQCRQWLAIR